MKSAIWLLLGLAVLPALAENASVPAKPATITPAALLQAAEDNNIAKQSEAAGMLAPPPASQRNTAAARGPQPSGALLPPPPPAEIAAASAQLRQKAAPAPASIASPPTFEVRNAKVAVPAPAAASAIAPPAPLPKKGLATDFAGPDVAVILARNQFFPASIKLHAGNPTRLLFTTVNRKPGALILERLQVQRWIPGEAPAPLTEAERAKMEVDRELNSLKITEIVIDPKPGEYTFYDALSGASGEIIVE